MATKSAWLILTFAAVLLVTGIPYWQPAYNVVQLPDGLLGPGALFTIAMAALCRVFAPASIRLVIGIVVAALLAVVSIRIGMDTAVDPTTHNLLPFELAIALVVGLVLGLIGALGGTAVRTLVRMVRGAGRS